MPKEVVSLFFLLFSFILFAGFYCNILLQTVVSEAISIYKRAKQIMAFKCIQSLAASAFNNNVLSLIRLRVKCLTRDQK